MSETVRVYHGSKRGLEAAIRADRGYPTNDFGAGFYLGDEKSQPLTLICRGESPMLYTCDLDLTGLRVFRFGDDRDWALFVAWNRDMVPDAFRGVFDARFGSIRAEHDVLVGRIANDRMFIVLDMFFKNALSDTAGKRACDGEAIFWAGFIYRFWNFKTGEASRAIHARFPLAEVLSVYPGFHTLDNNRAVDEMIELARKRAA